MGCVCVSQGQGGDLLAAAAALSVLIAQGKTADQIDLLATLFNVIGDNLALLAAKVPNGEAFCPENKESAKSVAAKKENTGPIDRNGPCAWSG